MRDLQLLYDSRFLDYIGTWDITGKVGSSDFAPTTAKVYLGNAIDAAGVFPCLMHIAVDGGYYLGLDKLDTTVGTGGSSFWYPESMLPRRISQTTLCPWT